MPLLELAILVGVFCFDVLRSNNYSRTTRPKNAWENGVHNTVTHTNYENYRSVFRFNLKPKQEKRLRRDKKSPKGIKREKQRAIFGVLMGMNDDILGAEMAKPGERGVSTKISEEKYNELEEALSFYGISRSKFVKFCIDALIELYKRKQKLSVPIEFTPGQGLPGEINDPSSDNEKRSS